jgi:hypothetical protein
VRSSIALVLLIVSAVGVGVGIGWWIHPGAGITVGFALLGIVALLTDDGKARR